MIRLAAPGKVGVNQRTSAAKKPRSFNEFSTMRLDAELHTAPKPIDDRCTRCGLPASWDITILDDGGVCNYCRYYDTMRKELRDFDRWSQLFADHLDRHRGKYAYDAVVGFSGGKDSSYILHMLKNHSGYNVLAATCNFGFMPAGPALDNITRVTQHLGVDHVFYDFPPGLIQRTFRAAIRHGLPVCLPCSSLCWLVTRKIAIERHIPFIVSGADRGQLLHSLSAETDHASGAADIWDMLTPYSEEKTQRADNPQTARKLRAWLRRFDLPAEYCAELCPDAEFLPGTNAAPLPLPYFLFHPYREKEIKRILTREAGWRTPANDHLHAHHDCLLHDAAAAFLREATGHLKTVGEISVDVREGEISREEAIGVQEHERRRLDNLHEPYAIFQSYFGIAERDVLRAAKHYRRRIWLRRALLKLRMIVLRPRSQPLV